MGRRHGDEEAVVGALARGTLRPRDLQKLPAEWWAPGAIGEHHARLVCALEAVIEVTGRARIDVALRLLADPLAGRVIAGQCIGYLVGLARKGPNRRDALSALQRIEVAAWERFEAQRDVEKRERSVEVRALKAALAAALRGDRKSAALAAGRAGRALDAAG